MLRLFNVSTQATKTKYQNVQDLHLLIQSAIFSRSVLPPLVLTTLPLSPTAVSTQFPLPTEISLISIFHLFMYFWDNLSLCSPSSLGTSYVDHIGLELTGMTCPHLLDTGIQDQCHHTRHVPSSVPLPRLFPVTVSLPVHLCIKVLPNHRNTIQLFLFL